MTDFNVLWETTRKIGRLWSKNRYFIRDAILGFLSWIIKALSLTVSAHMHVCISVKDVCMCVCVCVITGICVVEHLSLQWRGLQRGQGQGSIYHHLLLRVQCVSRCCSRSVDTQNMKISLPPTQGKNKTGAASFHTSRETNIYFEIYLFTLN